MSTGALPRRWTVAALFSVALATGCRGPTPGEAGRGAVAGDHALALAPPDGSSLTDWAIARLEERLRDDPRQARLWVSLGEAWVRKAREAGDPALYRSADDAAEAARALSAGSPEAEAVHGFALLDAHRFLEARELARRLLQAYPGNATALGILADALLELGSFEEAAEAAQRMVDLKPSLPSYVRAAHLQWLQGDVEGALGTANLAADAGAEREPRAWVFVQVALMHWHRGELALADAALDRALELVPEYPQALSAKGRVALSRADFGSAAGWLERAWRRAPLPETAWLLGDAREGAGSRAGAEEAYERVVRGGRAFDRRTLALFYATKGRDLEEALRLVEDERRVRDDLYTEDAYAWVLYRSGRLADAERAADRANRLGTPDARLLYHLGAIRLARGERRKGRALLREALRLNPAFDPTGAKEALHLLGRDGAPSAGLAR